MNNHNDILQNWLLQLFSEIYKNAYQKSKTDQRLTNKPSDNEIEPRTKACYRA